MSETSAPWEPYTAAGVSRQVGVLDTYFFELDKLGLGVPGSSKDPMVVLLGYISERTGFPRWFIARSPSLLKTCERWVRKIGLCPIDKFPPDAPSVSFKPAALVSDYLARLGEEGKDVPGAPVGGPDWQRISEESGAPLASLVGNKAGVRMLRRRMEELGLECRHLNSGHSVVTYGMLFEEGDGCRQAELKGKPNAKAQLYNTRTHLRYFMEKLGGTEGEAALTDDDPVGRELLEGFEEAVAAVADSVGNYNTRRKFVGEMHRWKGYHLRLLGDGDLPPDFQRALSIAACHSGRTVADLARSAGVSATSLMTWIEGRNIPQVERGEEVRSLEEVLGLRPGALTSKLVKSPRPTVRGEEFPEQIVVDGTVVKIRGYEPLLKDLRHLLPNDFAQRTMPEREEVLRWLILNTARRGFTTGKHQKWYVGNPYAAKKFPPEAAREWEELARFKEDRLPPTDKMRSSAWVKSTTEMHKDMVGRFYGALNLPADAEDPRLRGLGLSPDHFTLGLFSQPALTRWWFDWRGLRRQQDDDEDRLKHSSMELTVAGSLCDHFKPQTGWIRQTPSLAERLRPIPGFIDDAFVARARADWGGVCDKAYAYYTTLSVELEDKVEEIRDPFDLIMPLLDTKHPNYTDPIAALRKFSQDIIADMPDPLLAPMAAARHMRKYLLVRILIVTGLRSKNLRQLTYRDDNTGHLRREGEYWVIEIPWWEFKNKDSSFFGTKKKKRNYKKTLRDTDGLYRRIEYYVRVHRHILLAGTPSDIFIVKSAAIPKYMARDLYEMYYDLTMIYLVHNPYRGTGIPGVRQHGPHAVRDILATYMLVKTGSYQLAAYIIGDSERTIRKHYARFHPQDKIHIADQIINAAWES